MGRPRQFDEDEAIARAAAVFRERGYASTSIDHLVEATGVHRGSLYGIFASKRGLFVRVLERIDPTRAADLDIALIALLEQAPVDGEVRALTLGRLAQSGVTPADLGKRLLARAGDPTRPTERTTP